jgi:hypothetical protein
MKINNNTRFPYPVLCEATGDYLEGSFSVSALIEEKTGTGKLKMDYTVSIDEAKLKEKFDNKSAVAGVFISCPDVFYNQLTPLPDISGQLEFAPGQLKGKVSIRPLLWAAESIKKYSNKNLHEDYGNASWDFTEGSLLAIGNELVINVGHEKLAPLESIFNLAIDEEVAEGEIRVNTDKDKITILCYPETYQLINGLRGTKTGQSILLNSIYLPVVMEVLSHLKDGESNFEDKKWYKVFNAKCTHLNIDYESGSFLEDAQKLLKFPVKKIKSIVEEL